MNREPQGATHPGWFKRTFWYFCSAQSSVFVKATDHTIIAESYPSLDISTAGHVAMAIMWVMCVFAYGVFVTYQHFTVADKETFAHLPAAGYDAPIVSVDAWCTNPPNCGDITISADYSTVDGCKSLAPVSVTVPAATGSTNRSVDVPLCYTGEHVYSTNNGLPLPANLGLLVDFSRINPGYDQWGNGNGADAAQGAIRIRAAGGTEKLIFLESWQVKSLTMGQEITNKYKEITSQVVFPINMQYEGRRPSWRATAVIQLASYADVTTIKKRSADFSLLGFMKLMTGLCGMAFMMNSLNNFYIPLFKKICPGPAELARRQANKETAEVNEGAKHEAEELMATQPMDDL